MNLLYYTAFGDIYRTFLELSLKSVKPFLSDFEVVIFSDKKIEGWETIVIEKELSVIEKMTFRAYIPEYIDVSKYGQIWFCDPDVIFKKNPFENYKNETQIKVSREIWTTLESHKQWFAQYMDEHVFENFKNENGINGGFFMIPKKHHSLFYSNYKSLIIKYLVENPDDVSIDQQALNSLYYSNALQMSAFPDDYVGFPARFECENHVLKHFACYPNEEKKRLMLLEK